MSLGWWVRTGGPAGKLRSVPGWGRRARGTRLTAVGGWNGVGVGSGYAVRRTGIRSVWVRSPARAVGGLGTVVRTDVRGSGLGGMALVRVAGEVVSAGDEVCLIASLGVRALTSDHQTSPRLGVVRSRGADGGGRPNVRVIVRDLGSGLHVAT